MKARLAAIALAAALAPAAGGADDAAKDALARSIDGRAAAYAQVAHQIWEWAEVGYQEQRSSALLQEELRRAGFEVKAGVAGIPTAFVASHGQGRPAIGILAEFDALPGLSQDAVPERRPLVRDGAGHACGHHLFGTASVAAAIAVREWLGSARVEGTIRLYGTPAEEGGAAKVYMARAGLFGDLDAVLHWHPRDRNGAGVVRTNAIRSAKFRFHGAPAHAAQSPERGRSALDGVEAMNFMANLLREHVPEETRIHYVITRGGGAPNVVPEHAEVYYYVRHPDARILLEIWDRLLAAAEAAARGTGTRVEHEVIGGDHALLPNETLARLVDANLRRVGGVRYDPAERAFAEKLHATLEAPDRALGSEVEVEPFEPQDRRGSTDVGDVSWLVPTAGLSTATWVAGTPAHSWQAAAAGGTSIGTKGMLNAAKVLAFSAFDLYGRPETLAEARAELERRRGPGFRYVPLVGDRKPPLDYRD